MATPKNKAIEPADLTLAAVWDTIKAGGKIKLAAGTSEETSIRILETQLGATTAEELFGGSALLKAKEYVNRPFKLTDVEFRNEDDQYADSTGIGIYAVLHTVSAGGEIQTFGCGGRDVVVKCLKAKELGVLPRWLKFTTDTTAAGFTVIKLVTAEAEAPDETF
jgi:hypothetical protein